MYTRSFPVFPILNPPRQAFPSYAAANNFRTPHYADETGSVGLSSSQNAAQNASVNPPATSSVKPSPAQKRPVAPAAVRILNPAHLGNDNILMQKPLRYLGVLNEVAEIFKPILGPVYGFLWAGEVGYMASEALLNAKRTSEAVQRQPGQKDNAVFRHKFFSRAGFHLFATMLIPTLAISGVEPLFKGYRYTPLGGIKGTTSWLLHKTKLTEHLDTWATKTPRLVGNLLSRTSHHLPKWGPMAAAFVITPLIFKYFDPILEQATKRLFYPKAKTL